MASFGVTKNRSSQQASGSGRSFVDPSQAPFLDFLRQSGMDLAGQQAGQIGGVAQQGADQLGGFGQGFLQNLAGIAGGGGLPGADFLEQRLSQQNPFLDQQIGSLGQDISRQFNQTILPGIRREAASVGGLGGGRQGVAEGIASQGAQDAFSREAANLRFSDLGLRQGAATALQQGGLAQQGIQANAALGGIGGLGGLQQLGLSPFAAQFSPLANFASILGGPTVLNQQQNRSRGESAGSGFNIGFG